MKVSVSFPIKNKVFIRNPFPIAVGNKSYIIDIESEVAKSVSVTWSGISTEFAPQIENHQQDPVKVSINKRQSEQFVLFAEYDLRAWQSLLSAYVLVDIDFDIPTTRFAAENHSETEVIKIKSSSSRFHKPRTRGKEAFEIYGRAFLAIEEGRGQIEVMSHYREALIALDAGRSIDAYNNFYLFIESQFCRGKSSTPVVVKILMKQVDFINALGAAAKEYKEEKRAYPIRFKAIGLAGTDPEPLITEIVELRGLLRHHSLANPGRWNPNKQEQYVVEAVFLGSLCLKLAFPKTTQTIWKPPYLVQFQEQAKKGNFEVELAISVTIRNGDEADERHFDMKVPQIGLDAQLATAVLQKALEILDEQSPDAELFAIRARHKTQGTELFRYDVGPSLHRWELYLLPTLEESKDNCPADESFTSGLRMSL